MNKPISFRDVEKLSAFLDGQLPGPERRALESRLESDPGLASVMESLRQSRVVLRNLPQRRAPRNFTLSPQRVSKRPPLPRAFPAVQWATGLASLVFALSLAFNALAPLAARSLAAAPVGGKGGGNDTGAFVPQEVSTDAPAPEYAAEAAPEAAADAAPLPAASVDPTAGTAQTSLTPSPIATQGLLRDESTPTATPPGSALAFETNPTEEAVSKFAEPAITEPAVPAPEPAALAGWQIGLGIVILLGLAILFGMRRAAIRRWQKKAR